MMLSLSKESLAVRECKLRIEVTFEDRNLALQNSFYFSFRHLNRKSVCFWSEKPTLKKKLSDGA